MNGQSKSIETIKNSFAPHLYQFFSRFSFLSQNFILCQYM
jgi:hypothetical protein